MELIGQFLDGHVEVVIEVGGSAVPGGECDGMAAGSDTISDKGLGNEGGVGGDVDEDAIGVNEFAIEAHRHTNDDSRSGAG